MSKKTDTISKKFKDAILLSSCAVDPSLIVQLDIAVEEAVRNQSWCECSQYIPVTLSSSDMSTLLDRCSALGRGKQAIVLGGSFVVSTALLDRCVALFQPLAQEQARADLAKRASRASTASSSSSSTSSSSATASSPSLTSPPTTSPFEITLENTFSVSWAEGPSHVPSPLLFRLRGPLDSVVVLSVTGVADHAPFPVHISGNFVVIVLCGLGILAAGVAVFFLLRRLQSPQEPPFASFLHRSRNILRDRRKAEGASPSNSHPQPGEYFASSSAPGNSIPHNVTVAGQRRPFPLDGPMLLSPAVSAVSHVPLQPVSHSVVSSPLLAPVTAKIKRSF
eukprot:GILI01010076.1.p1 GENE.GILI01010076.1~~GILI01010076.1.p1  ORF type:complete len:336 (+),score=80.71 GILI01010076.1:3-1010(+)